MKRSQTIEKNEMSKSNIFMNDLFSAVSFGGGGSSGGSSNDSSSRSTYTDNTAREVRERMNQVSGVMQNLSDVQKSLHNQAMTTIRNIR